MNEINFPTGIQSRTIMVDLQPIDASRLFKEGDVQTARIIGRIDQQHWIIRFKGRHLLVESHIPLSAQEVTFRVEAVSPRVVLRILPNACERDSPELWLKNYLSTELTGSDWAKVLANLTRLRVDSIPPSVQQLFEDLLQLLQNFSPETFLREPDALRHILLMSGIFLEGKLRKIIEGNLERKAESVLKMDLKAFLLRLRESIGRSAVPEETSNFSKKEVEKGIENLIDRIELYQLMNLVEDPAEEKIFFLIPLWFSPEPRFVEMRLSLPRRNNKDRDTGWMSILFLLDLPGLGALKIEAIFNHRDLYCFFRVADRQVSAFFEEHVSLLEERLLDLGFSPHIQVSIEKAPKKENVFLDEIVANLNSIFSVLV